MEALVPQGEGGGYKTKIIILKVCGDFQLFKNIGLVQYLHQTSSRASADNNVTSERSYGPSSLAITGIGRPVHLSQQTNRWANRLPTDTCSSLELQT